MRAFRAFGVPTIRRYRNLLKNYAWVNRRLMIKEVGDKLKSMEISKLKDRFHELAIEHVARLDEIKSKTKRISELQGTIDSLKRQNKELQAEMIAKDGIIKKQTIMMEEAKPKEAKYIKAGNQYYCSNCEADFQHYELFNKYCPECGAHFSNHRKD